MDYNGRFVWKGVGGRPAYSKKQLKEYFGMNDSLICKVPEPTIRVHRCDYPDFYGYDAEIIESFIMQDWVRAELEQIKERKQKRIEARNAKHVPVTDANIAEALYIINKSAKKSRDTKRRAYYNRDHQVCHAAKTRAINLYETKNAALNSLIATGKAKYIGVNIQTHECGKTYLKLYSFGGFTFHMICAPEDIEDNAVMLKSIDGMISADVKRKTNINYNQAVQVLADYLAMVS